MALAEVSACLSACLRYFSAPPSGPQVPKDVERLGGAVTAAAAAWDDAPASERAAVLRQVVQIGTTLAELATSPAVVDALSDVSAGTWAPVDAQLHECGRVVLHCCTLAERGGLSPPEAFRFAQCASLFWRCGYRVLKVWVHSSAGSAHVWRQSRRLALAASGPSISSRMLLTTVQRAIGQMAGMCYLLNLLDRPELQSSRAAFAATVPRNCSAHSWLIAVSGTLEGARQAGHPLVDVLPTWASLCAQLLAAPVFFEVQDALAEAAGKQPLALVPLLLHALAEALGEFKAAWQGSAGSRAGSQTGSNGQADGGGSSSDGLAGLAGGVHGGLWLTRDPVYLLRTLLLAEAPCLTQPWQQHLLSEFAAGRSDAFNTVADALTAAAEAAAAPSPAAGSCGSDKRRRDITQLAEAAVGAWGQTCDVVSQWAEAATAQPSEEKQQIAAAAAVWAQRALQLLPAMADCAAAALQAGLGTRVLPQRRLLQSIVCTLRFAFEACSGVEPLDQEVAAEEEEKEAGQGAGQEQRRQACTAAEAQLLSLARGAAAALRLLHLTAELCPAESEHVSVEAAMLMSLCLHLAGRSLGKIQDSLQDEAHWAAGCPLLRSGTLVLQLRQLHAAACRLVHYAACASEEQRAAVPVLSDWLSILEVIAWAWPALQAGTQGVVPLSEWEVRGMAAAHVEALAVAVERARPQLEADPSVGEGVGKDVVDSFSHAVELAGSICSIDAIDALLDAMQLEMSRQGSTQTAAKHGFFLGKLSSLPSLAAARAVSRGMLVDIAVRSLSCALPVVDDQTDQSPDELSTARQCAKALLGVAHASLNTCLCNLLASAKQQASTGGQVAMPAGVAGTAQQLLIRPDQQPQTGDGQGEAQDVRAVLRRYCEQRVLPVAVPLAAAVEASLQQPEQQAAARLAAAQAAATRSCAYLRCANLGACGGPGPGQGVGSRRCGACRAAWYCNPICSHADWRTHRKSCPALAAERQEQKRQQQAAAAAEGETGS